MITREVIDADLARLRDELITAEDCHHHRPVAEIRAEIAVLKETRQTLPKQRRSPES